MSFRIPAALAAATLGGAVLVAPARAHVTVHPNVVPQGSFPAVNIRVPNEEAKADTTAVRVKLPAGVAFAAADPPPGWSFKAKTSKLAKPVKTDDGTITTQVDEVDFTGGRIPPGQFVSFPLQMGVPDSAKQGDLMKFPAVQTYSDGKVVRWIGAATADEPAPSVAVTAADGAVSDVADPTKLPASLTGGAEKAQAQPASKTVVKKQTSGLSVVAIVVGALGLAAGAAALATRRRA